MTEDSISLCEQLLLEKCMMIELKNKELYDVFSQIFASQQDVAELWKKTSDEELNHANQFALALKMKKGLTCSVTMESEKVDAVLLKLQKLIEKVSLNPPELLTALQWAIRLENILAEFHLTCVVAFTGENPLKGLFEAMMASDNEHVTSLQNMYEKLLAS